MRPIDADSGKIGWTLFAACDMGIEALSAALLVHEHNKSDMFFECPSLLQLQ